MAQPYSRPRSDREGLHADFGFLVGCNNHEELTGLRLVSCIDPISGEREITLYTDDGEGNGVAVLTIVDPGMVRA